MKLHLRFMEKFTQGLKLWCNGRVTQRKVNISPSVYKVVKPFWSPWWIRGFHLSMEQNKFHYQLICQLFHRLTMWSIKQWNGDVIKCLVFIRPTVQHPKRKHLLYIRWEKAANSYIWNHQMFGTLLKKLLKELLVLFN